MTHDRPSEMWDVIVVGAGGTGLMAALTAARLGKSVLVLEKADRTGGTSAMSFGVFTTSASPHQRAEGVDDDPDAHFEDLDNFAGKLINRDNLALRRVLVDNAPEAFQTLLDLGAVFSQPISEPGHRVPRLHKMLPHSRGVMEQVARKCRAAGVRFRTGADVVDLIESGQQVIGVRLRQGDVLKARLGVLLATGDFSNASKPFKLNYLSPELAQIPGINAKSSGDGQQLGLKLGSEICNGDLIWGPEIRFLERPTATLLSRIPGNGVFARMVKLAVDLLPQKILRPFMMSFVTTSLRPGRLLYEQGAILVNKNGERFCDELDLPEVHAEDQPDGEVFVVFDDKVAKKFTGGANYVSTAPGIDYAYLPDYAHHRKDIYHKADTLADVAHRAGVKPDNLETTAKMASEDAGKSVQTPPFYILGPARAWIFFTEGGLKVNERLQVLRADGSVVRGLFAAGSAGQGGLLLNGHGHHIAWAFTSGMVAARGLCQDGAE